MSRRWLLILALLAGPLGRTASAQGKVTADQRATAEQLFRTGERFFKADKFLDAAESFEQAYAVLPLPAIAFSAGQAYRLQYAADNDPRKLKRAVDLYDRYLADEPRGPRAGDATRNLAALRPMLKQLERESGNIAGMPAVLRTTKLMVSTTADVPGARASIDGGPAEALPLMAEVAPGRHRIVIEAKGYLRFDESREALDGQTRPIEVELVPKPATVRVRAEAGAQVSVDGRPAGVTPLVRPLELAQGKHLVTVTRRGHRPWSREIAVERGQTVELDASLRRTGQRAISYVVLGTAAALAIASGVTFGMSLAAGGDASDLNDKRESEGLSAEEHDHYIELVERRDDRLQATYILLGVTGAVAVSGALLYYMDNPAAEADASAAASFSVAPTAGAHSLGLALGGRF